MDYSFQQQDTVQGGAAKQPQVQEFTAPESEYLDTSQFKGGLSAIWNGNGYNYMADDHTIIGTSSDIGQPIKRVADKKTVSALADANNQMFDAQQAGGPMVSLPLGGSMPAPTTTQATGPAPMEMPKFNLGTMQGPSTWEVDPKTQTVAGQLESVIAKDSPLMQQARARAMQSMQQRGMLNSSMAMGAADSAMYDSALRIATPDAQTYADAAKTNMGARNQFSLQANDFTQQGAMAEYETAAREWGAQNDFGRTTQRDATLHGYDLENKDVDFGYQTQRDATLHGYDLDKMGLADYYQTNRDATLHGYDLENMGTEFGYQTQRDATLHGYDIDTMTLQQDFNLETMDQEQYNLLERLATEQGYNLETMDQEQINLLARMATEQGYNLDTLAVQQDYNLETMDAQQYNLLEKLATEQGYNLETMSQQQIDTLARMAAEQGYITENKVLDADIQATRDKTLQSYTAANKTFDARTQTERDRALAGYDTGRINTQADADIRKLNAADKIDTAKDNRNNDATGRRQASGNVTSIMQTAENALADLDKMEGLDAKTRTAKRNQIKSNAKASLSMIGALAGDIDLGSFMDDLFEDAPGPTTVTYDAGTKAQPGTVAAKGSAADVAPMVAEAEKRAAANGTTRAQELWKEANKSGFSDAEMDTYFNQPPGTAAQVRAQLGK